MKMRKIKNWKLLLGTVLVSIFVFISCNSTEKNKEKQTEEKQQSAVYNTKGYQLMQQKCFICHFEKPNPDKRLSMIAPPMLRVQEHYKPTYKTKEEFVNAVSAFVNNPDESKSLMPGAVRKFNLMPKLAYPPEEIKLIAEALYDTDFGTMPKMKMEQGTLSLNNGAKWKLKPESIEQVRKVTEMLNNFQSDNIADYNRLGTDVFNTAKLILLDSDYTGEVLDQIHFFFGGIEEKIHDLEAAQSVKQGDELIEELKQEFAKFDNYFE